MQNGKHIARKEAQTKRCATEQLFGCLHPRYLLFSVVTSHN